MKKFGILTQFVVLIMLAWSCGKKEAPFTDYETITKDDTFRTGIKTGSFVKLSAGYTYYEYENRNADTILVMVHGFSVPSYVWDSTFHAAVARGYGALRYDTYGRGYSDNPDVPYDVALFSQQLKELLDSLHIEKPFNLLGLSDGGRTISAFASQYPKLISNLIYVDPTGFEVITNTAQDPIVTDEEILTFKRNRYPTMAAGQLSDFYDSIPFRGWAARYTDMMRYKGFVRALISTNRHRATIEHDHRTIAATGIPVFAFWGEHDTVVPLEQVRGNLMERIPTVKLFVIPNAGHLPHIEQAQVFNLILFKEIVGGKL